MPAPLHNRNAAKAEGPCDSQLFVRCMGTEKARWVRAAQDHGGLSPWVIATLNRAAQREERRKGWLRRARRMAGA